MMPMTLLYTNRTIYQPYQPYHILTVPTAAVYRLSFCIAFLPSPQDGSLPLRQTQPRPSGGGRHARAHARGCSRRFDVQGAGRGLVHRVAAGGVSGVGRHHGRERDPPRAALLVGTVSETGTGVGTGTGSSRLVQSSSIAVRCMNTLFGGGVGRVLAMRV